MILKVVVLALILSSKAIVLFTQPKINDVKLENIISLSKPENYDKYASIAVDAQNNTWVSFTSMQNEKEKIIVTLKNNIGWSNEMQIDNGEGIESYSKLLITKNNRLWVFWQGKRNGKWAVYARSRFNDKWDKEVKLTPLSENCFHPNILEDENGRIWLTYEKIATSRIDVEVIVLENNKWSSPFLLTKGNINRRVSMAADKKGKVWMAWDSPVSGNYDIWLKCLSKPKNKPFIVDTTIQATKSLSIDDSPSITCSEDGTVWLAWNSLRSLQRESNRSDQHAGAIFLKAYKDGKWFVTNKISDELMLGEISYVNIDKTPNDAEDEYWHWKQTQSFPVLYFDNQQQLWIAWRTDMYGAHNFDIWARVYNGKAWSDLLQLTTFSPGRDEWPSFAKINENQIAMVWEAQTLPVEGQEDKLMGGFVDAYNTNANNNVIVYGDIKNVNYNWHLNELQNVDIEKIDSAIDIEIPLPTANPTTFISKDNKSNIYFGDPHSHTVLSDGKYGWADQIIFLSKEKLGVDFSVISDHSEMGRLQNSEYEELALLAKSFSEDNKYIDFQGFEWTAPPGFGHRIIIYPDLTSPNISSAQEKGNSTEKLYNFIKPFGGIASTHHSGQAIWGRWNPQALFNQNLEPNFEIVSFHGRFEYYKNPLEGRKQVPGHQYQDALKMGRHSGILGASDTHFLSPGEGGLTAVLSESLTRENIFEAIKNRRTYATTGVKIALNFSINDAVMGSEISLASGDSLNFTISVNGTAPIDHIEIVKNSEDYFSITRILQIPGTTKGTFLVYDPAKPQGSSKIATDDLTSFKIKLTENRKLAKETSYYIRVTQIDGHQAWSSPIWILPSL